MLLAIMDIGSSTIRLAIYQRQQNEFSLIFKKKRTVGLSAYIRAGNLTAEGIEKAGQVLCEFQNFLRELGIKKQFVLATAAIRNAGNRTDILREIYRMTKLKVRVLSGEEEAFFDFAGIQGNVLKTSFIVDIGGGSTEWLYQKDGRIVQSHSFPIGALSLYKEYVSGFLPTPAELVILRKVVQEHLRRAIPWPQVQRPVLYGMGGTMKSLYYLYRKIFSASKSEGMSIMNLAKIIGIYSKKEVLSERETVFLLTASGRE